MHRIALAVVVALALGGLTGCSSSSTSAPAAGAAGGPPPENSGVTGSPKNKKAPTPDEKGRRLPGEK